MCLSLQIRCINENLPLGTSLQYIPLQLPIQINPEECVLSLVNSMSDQFVNQVTSEC